MKNSTFSINKFFYFIEIQFVFLFFNFLIIHFMTMNNLGFSLAKNLFYKIISIYIMVCNDFVVSLVLTFILSLFVLIIVYFKYAKIIFFIFNFILSSFLSLFILYSDFFRSNISILHLKFLLDAEFLNSSYMAILDIKYIMVVIINSILLIIILNFYNNNLNKIKIKLLGLVVLTCVFILTRNFLNESKITSQIRQNIAEKNATQNFLYFIFDEYTSEKFRDDKFIVYNLNHDYNVLYKWKYGNISNKKNITDENLLAIIQEYSFTSENLVAIDLKKQIQNKLNSNSKMYIWIVILESFKPQNGKWLYPNHPYSFMPFYDKLAESGIAFTNAWTTGNVTRVGQQSTLCGTITGEYSDALRSNFRYNPVCLPEALKRKYPLSKSFFWYAGDLRFDSTKLFWMRHGFDFISGINDFDSKALRTSWGVSDKSLFDKIQKDLLSQESNYNLQLHTIMTLTNHHDFSVPNDLELRDTALMQKATQKMQVSTYYTDQSLEQFIHFMKNVKLHSSGGTLWDDSLIFLINDHGSPVPDLAYPNNQDSLDIIVDMHFRGNLIIQGGIVQNALKNNNINQLTIDRLSSQSDIFPSVLEFLDFKKIRSVSDSLFAKNRRWPVYSEAMGKVFIHPQILKSRPTVVWNRSDLLLNKNISISGQDSDYYLTAASLFRINEYLKFKGLLY